MTYDPAAAYEERMEAVDRCMASLAKKKGVTMVNIKTQWHHAYGPETKTKLIEAELELMRKETVDE